MTNHSHRILAGLAAAALPFTLLACSDSDDDEEVDAGGGSTAQEQTATSAGGAGIPHTEASPEDLEIWQADLNAVGCWAGPVDGALGPQTEAAIQAYQAAKGLTVDGLLGPATEGALQEDVAAGATVCSSTTATTAGGSGEVSGGSASLSSASYDKTFVIGSCTNEGETDLVLQAQADNLTLQVDAPSGSGSLSVSGGTEEDGITLNGSISSVTVGDDGSFTAEGTFGPPTNAGEAFTLTGSCAAG